MAIATPAPRVLADALPRSVARDVALVLGGAAFVGLAAQVILPLPFTPVPITGQTFAVLLAGAALGSARGALSMLVYALVGMFVPWYAGGTTAFADGKLTASFGYVIGFIAAAWAVGRLAEAGWTRTPWHTAGAMVLGNLIIYAIGVSWLAVSMGVGLGQAVEWGLTPFLWGDLAKLLLAAGLFPLAWLGLKKSGLTPPR